VNDCRTSERPIASGKSNLERFPLFDQRLDEGRQSPGATGKNLLTLDSPGTMISPFLRSDRFHAQVCDRAPCFD